MMRHLSGRLDGSMTVTTSTVERCSRCLTSYVGSALASTGDNGKVHLWKQSLSGDYAEFAETDETDDR